jgi:predicted porin
MKQACLAAGLAACSTLCHAQGGITLYGRFDAGISYTTGVRDAAGGRGNSWRGESGNWGASWLGLSGDEGLGGGDAAFFALEQGIDLMHGTGNAGPDVLFGRKSYVGYRSRDYGALRLGRDLSLGNYQWDMDPMMQELYSSTALMRWRNSSVINNAIGYQSPVLRGCDVFLQHSPGERPGAYNQGATGGYGRTDSIQLTYTGAALELRSQFSQFRDADGRFSNLFVASREAFAGVAYKLDGATTLQAGYNHLSAPDTPAGLADRADHGWLGAKVQATPHWLLSGALYHMRVTGGGGDATHDGAGRAILLAAGAMYLFSKNTFWYLSLAHVSNSTGAQFGVGARNPGSDNGNLDNPAPGKAQNGMYTGINATF